MFDFLTPYLTAIKIAIAVAVLGGAFYAGWHVSGLSYEAAIAEQKKEAAEQLAAAQAQVALHQQHVDALNLQTEHDYAEHKAALAAKDADLQRVAGDLDRLRKSRRGPGGNGPVSSHADTAAGAGGGPAGDPGVAPGSYSELAQIAADAVATAEYARACHDWVTGLARVDPAAGVAPAH